MDDLIQKLSAQLGIDADTANAATGQAMAMLKNKVGGDLFEKISGAIPGAENAAAAATEKANESDAGVMGALSGMASKVFGSSAGEAMELDATLKSAGLSADQMGGFANTVIEYLKDKLGDDVLNQILAKAPMLKNLLN
ncbi:DUF2780 domain-containing protein [Novipirellula artificiosorum]|uniref:DUF2780 domain-containing protein n=1 Tax=Novipirellula artificiosorum TaxID=2528016 RepID=A0A5C6E0Z5_9BACT|nr:DUF2780 domain-containing protein [Novipirellula artificiosorum]TWU42530.1 hypothetical protein Poly41_08270 [Novipirellula artificiosorum]